MQPVEAPSGKEEDVKAARFMDVLWNEAMPGPAYGKGYRSLHHSKQQCPASHVMAPPPEAEISTQRSRQ